MSFSRTSTCSNTSSNQRKHFLIERRPKMLKDFLIDDSNSCSSSGFKSFPRRVDQDHHSVRNLIQIDLDHARKSSKRLQRSRSKKAASATISAFQFLINSVKSIQFTAVKSPSILPQSLSRRLSKKSHHSHVQNKASSSSEVKMIMTTVKIKDIVRWKSFRDLVEEKPQPSDHIHHLPSSLDHRITTSTGSTNTSRSSNVSSWCDSDFTSEYLPSWGGNCENEVELGKQYSLCVGRDSMEATTESPAIYEVGPKDDLACEEEEQRSPVSILDFNDQFEEDSFSSNVERTQQKLMQNIRCFESLAKIDPINLDKWMSMEANGGCEDNDDSDYKEDEEINEVEEKAKLLLNHVKATSFMKTSNDSGILEQMLLDFFIEELSTNRNQNRNDEADSEMIRLAKAWINGKQSGTTFVELEACVIEMDRKERWCKFDDQEQEEMGLQIEKGLLNMLLDELLDDLLLC
ncbi:hypothetical protein ACOSQ2_001102 [Xanthoceras sorbifolium]